MAALAHLPDPFFSLPFRLGKNDAPDWKLCLKFISTNHASNNTSSLEEALARMNTLRKIILQTCRADASSPLTEAFIENTLKPYCQLVAMAQAHLPLYRGKVHKNMIFAWRDSFDTHHTNESQNGNLELICCIYNLAASWTHLAQHQAQSGAADDVKNAFKSFQNAAGYYEMVEQMLDRLPPEHVESDLTPESLALLRRMCLTMAHHCAYLKAESDMKGNHAMLAKIAREGGKQYEETANSTRASEWFKKYKKTSSVTQIEQLLTTLSLVFYARSHLHMAASQTSDETVGVAIAHLNKANEHLSKISKLPTESLRSWISGIITNVNKEHEKAIVTNESVYFARVPKEVDTPNGLSKPLGKATPHPSFTLFESKRGEDPFFGIIPAHIAAIVSTWREKQRNLVSICNKSCLASRKRANEQFQTLGVNTVIGVVSSESNSRGKLPMYLREKIESLRKDEKGATINLIEHLLSTVKTCEALWAACNEKVQQVKDELERERKEDEAYIVAYGERMWRSVHRPSNEVAEHVLIQSALCDHERGLKQWLQEPLTKAKAVLEENVRDIVRLEWPISDLDALMPFVETQAARQQNEKVLEKIEVLNKLTQRKQSAEEEQEARLRELNDMIESDAVTFAISAVESNHHDAVLDRETQKISDAIERVNATVREMEKIMAEMEETMNGVGLLKSSDPLLGEIQKVCNGLESACSVYSNLRQEFREIVRYATSALDGLEVTLSNAQSFTVCRKLEAEGLKENLDVQISQKMSEMQQNTAYEDAIQDSRRRQNELLSQIQRLDAQQQQREPERAERMAEILRRQREMATFFHDSSPPTVFSGATAPPSYDAVMNAPPYLAAPPPPPPSVPPPPLSATKTVPRPQYRPL